MMKKDFMVFNFGDGNNGAEIMKKKFAVLILVIANHRVRISCRLDLFCGAAGTGTVLGLLW